MKSFHKPGENKTNAMIDIETLSVKTNAVIFSIACVIFNPHKKHIEDFVIDKIRINISRDGQEELGLETDENAIALWNKDELKEIFKILNTNQVNIKEGLINLTKFISKYNVYKIWANSPNFDMVILETAFDKCGLKKPWNFWQFMDVRTVMNLDFHLLKGNPITRKGKDEWVKYYSEKKKKLKNKITSFDKEVMSEHDPLYDCYSQICNIQKCLCFNGRALKKIKTENN